MLNRVEEELLFTSDLAKADDIEHQEFTENAVILMILSHGVVQFCKFYFRVSLQPELIKSIRVIFYREGRASRKFGGSGTLPQIKREDHLYFF